MIIDTSPCKRYYLNARFENNVSQKWQPVIDYAEDIAGWTIVAKK